MPENNFGDKSGIDLMMSGNIITSANFDPDLCCQVVPLDRNESFFLHCTYIGNHSSDS